MFTEHLFSNDAISASTPFSNYVKRNQQLEMAKNKRNKLKEQNLKMCMCPERSFVKPVVKDFLTERKNRGEFVFDFDLGGRIPPPKPLGFERDIDMGGCHLLEFLYCHI
jgi:hypothetical protein